MMKKLLLVAAVVLLVAASAMPAAFAEEPLPEVPVEVDDATGTIEETVEQVEEVAATTDDVVEQAETTVEETAPEAPAEVEVAAETTETVSRSVDDAQSAPSAITTSSSADPSTTPSTSISATSSPTQSSTAMRGDPGGDAPGESAESGAAVQRSSTGVMSRASIGRASVSILASSASLGEKKPPRNLDLEDLVNVGQEIDLPSVLGKTIARGDQSAEVVADDAPGSSGPGKLAQTGFEVSLFLLLGLLAVSLGRAMARKPAAI